MLLPERQEVFRQFIQDYEFVRQAEGRGSSSSAYYQALPYRDLREHMAIDWRIGQPVSMASSNGCLLRWNGSMVCRCTSWI